MLLPSTPAVQAAPPVGSTPLPVTSGLLVASDAVSVMSEGVVLDRGVTRPKSTKVTPRDREIISWLARGRWATGRQVAVAFGMHYSNVRRRLGALRTLGLVDSVATGPSRFLLWRATEDGVGLTGLNLPVPKRIAWGTIIHTLGLIDLSTAFAAAGELVLTEAEIRATDTRNAVSDRMAIARGQGHRVISDRPLFAIGARAGGSKNNLHIPDLVLARPFRDDAPGAPQSIAIELELRRKTPSRIRETLRAYSAAPNIGLVCVFTHDKQVRDLVDQCAKDTATTDIVVIRRWEPSFETGL